MASAGFCRVSRRELASGGLTAAVVEATTTRDKSLRSSMPSTRHWPPDGFTPMTAFGTRRSLPKCANGRRAGAATTGWTPYPGPLLSEPVRLPRTPRPKASEARAGANWRPGSRGFRAKTGFKV